MGKKIPAKKHRGIKDPVKQNEERLAKIKTKINEAPANIDQQEVPKKLRMLFKSKEKRPKKVPTDSEKAKTKKEKGPNKYAPQRPLKPIPDFDRKPGEADKDYLWRTEVTARNFLNKAKFEHKYDVDVMTDKKTGEVEVKKRDLKHLDNGLQEKPTTRKEKKILKQKAAKEEKLKLRKEKFKMKKLAKKEKKNDGFERVKSDVVEFGDVVQEPPQLTAKPRKSEIDNQVTRAQATCTNVTYITKTVFSNSLAEGTCSSRTYFPETSPPP